MELANQNSGPYTEADYDRLPEDAHTELINGIFYDKEFPNRKHQQILGDLLFSIHDYIKAHKKSDHIYPGPFAVKLFNDEKTIVEPDISVICDPKKLTDKGCSGAPDWIIEITSPSNPRHDYITKLNLYSSAGVREYWIVDPQHDKVHVYSMEKDNFTLNNYTFSDKIKVGIYEDFTIDASTFDI